MDLTQGLMETELFPHFAANWEYFAAKKGCDSTEPWALCSFLLKLSLDYMKQC